MNEKKRPEKKFRAWSITAAIWKNEGTTSTGEKTEFNTVTLQRSFKDQKGAWQNASSFRAQDLPLVGLVLDEAYRHLVLKGEVVEENSTGEAGT